MKRSAPIVEQHVIARVSEFPPGSRRVVMISGKSIGVFNIDGEFFALRNVCPHQGAPLCRGELTDLSVARFAGDDPPQREVERHGEILRCPWHGWEFDIRTGDAVIQEGWRVGTYRAFVQDAEGSPVPDAPVDGVPGPVETFVVTVERGHVVVEIPG
jgi:3-phenylpropionate/trans-cinnamate dioxygenase ferredoxin subunit